MALYHKHRPQIFATVIGQEPIVTTLENEIKTGRLAHAYLFSGPRGVGKTTTARVFAKALNCRKRTEGNVEPCDTCDSCTEITNGRSIDVIEMDAASHTGVDNVRENIIDNAQFQPTRSPWKIFIIDEVHMLSTSAFNALLKTLEEPPAHVLFILATTEIQKLPETIVSRCQRFTFKRIPSDILSKHLQEIAEEEGVVLTTDVLARLVRKSDGCARDAVSLLDQLLATGEKKIDAAIASIILPTSNLEGVETFVAALIEKQAGTALANIHSAVESGEQPLQFANDALEFLRQVLVVQAGSALGRSSLDLGETSEKHIAALGKMISASDLIRLIDILFHRRNEVKTSPIPELPLEVAVVEWCSEVTTSATPIKPPIQPPPRVTSVAQTPTEEKKLSPPPVEIIKIKEEAVIEKTGAAPPVVLEEKNISLEEAQRVWNACIEELETISPSLVLILKMTRLLGIHGTTLLLQTAYAFHRDRLAEKTTTKKLLDMLSEKLHTPVLIEVEIDQNPQSDQEIQEIAAVFGGEVV